MAAAAAHTHTHGGQPCGHDHGHDRGNEHGPEADEDEASDDEVVVEGAAGAAKKKKKKKKGKKGKKRAPLGTIPPERIPSLNETPEETAKWEAELSPGARTVALDMWGLLNERERPKLNILRTPACANFALETPRLVLRQVETGDTTAIRRIKMEPIVQKTQLYGAPAASDIKESFQRRYVASSIPRISRQGAWRSDYIFAITAKPNAGIQLAPAGNVKIGNRITSTEGYIGNIALSLETAADHDHAHCGGHGHSHADPDPALSPQPGTVWRHPSFADCSRAKLVGKMFYELHPQLWAQGIVSEAFGEVLRFAIEEVGCEVVTADPTVGNDASIRVCEKFGLVFSHESDQNAWNKPQLFHAITREQWFKRNRGAVPADGAWSGKETCRWCTDFRTRPVITCRCGWAKYCSRECQRADWVCKGGHQGECK